MLIQKLISAVDMFYHNRTVVCVSLEMIRRVFQRPIFPSTMSTDHPLGSGEKRRIEWEGTGGAQPRHTYSGQMLVIEDGCSTKPKLFSHFLKLRETSPDGTKTSLHYAHFKVCIAILCIDIYYITYLHIKVLFCIKYIYTSKLFKSRMVFNLYSLSGIGAIVW